MKGQIILLLLVCIAFSCVAQNGGLLDSTFGTYGKVVTSITPNSDVARSVAIQTDGKILVAGSSTSNVTGIDFTCVRYNTDGKIDSTFGVNGIVTTDVQLGSLDEVYDMVLLSTGSFILAGSSDNGTDQDAAMVKYLSNGTIDSTFGTNGVVLTDFKNGDADRINSITIHQLTGNIVVGGHARYSYLRTSDHTTLVLLAPVIARYLPTGALDASFNSNGINMLFAMPNTSGFAEGKLYNIKDVAVASNGKITGAGWYQYGDAPFNNHTEYWYVRLNSNGTYDNTFDGDGQAFNTGFNTGANRANSIILNADNSFLAAGTGYTSVVNLLDFSCYNYQSNGTTINWIVANAVGVSRDSDEVYKLLKDADGKYVMVGSVVGVTSSGSTFALGRLNNNGSDDAFGPGGDFKVTTAFTQGNSQAFDGAIQADGKIVVVGYAGNNFAIARYFGGLGPIVLNPVTLTSPYNEFYDCTPGNNTFSWQSQPNATGYVLEVDTLANMTTASSYTVTGISKSLLLNIGQTHYWRVRATESGNLGPWSSVWRLYNMNMDSLNMLYPADGADSVDYTSVTMRWSTLTGNFPNMEYSTDLDTFPFFASLLHTGTTTSDTTYTVSNLIPGTTYYWKVRGQKQSCFGNGQVASFTTRPLPPLPSGIAVTETVGLKLYPNPVSDKLTIKTSQILTDGEILITNALGEVMHRQQFSQLDTLQLNFNYKAGLYFVYIKTASGSLVRKVVAE